MVETIIKCITIVSIFTTDYWSSKFFQDPLGSPGSLTSRALRLAIRKKLGIRSCVPATHPTFEKLLTLFVF